MAASFLTTTTTTMTMMISVMPKNRKTAEHIMKTKHTKLKKKKLKMKMMRIMMTGMRTAQITCPMPSDNANLAQMIALESDYESAIAQ